MKIKKQNRDRAYRQRAEAKQAAAVPSGWRPPDLPLTEPQSYTPVSAHSLRDLRLPQPTHPRRQRPLSTSNLPRCMHARICIYAHMYMLHRRVVNDIRRRIPTYVAARDPYSRRACPCVAGESRGARQQHAACSMQRSPPARQTMCTSSPPRCTLRGCGMLLQAQSSSRRQPSAGSCPAAFSAPGAWVADSRLRGDAGSRGVDAAFALGLLRDRAEGTCEGEPLTSLLSPRRLGSALLTPFSTRSSYCRKSFFPALPPGCCASSSAPANPGSQSGSPVRTCTGDASAGPELDPPPDGEPEADSRPPGHAGGADDPRSCSCGRPGCTRVSSKSALPPAARSTPQQQGVSTRDARGGAWTRRRADSAARRLGGAQAACGRYLAPSPC